MGIIMTVQHSCFCWVPQCHNGAQTASSQGLCRTQLPHSARSILFSVQCSEWGPLPDMLSSTLQTFYFLPDEEALAEAEAPAAGREQHSTMLRFAD